MIFLLADSTPFFIADSNFRTRLKQVFGPQKRLVYLGASNGDAEQYYQMFLAASEQLQAAARHHLRAPYDARALAVLAQADLVLLSGGDVAHGWAALGQPAVLQVFEQLMQRQVCFIVIGISAGAMQMGAFACDGETVLPMLGWLPWMIGVHEEKTGWQDFRQQLNRSREGHADLTGLGVCSGTALLVAEKIGGSDFSLETLGGQAVWFSGCGNHENMSFDPCLK